MKITLYTELKPTLPNIKIILESIKKVPNVESVQIIDPNKMRIECDEMGEKYFFGSNEFKKEESDVVIIRGGFKHVSATIEFIKYCRKEGIKIFDNHFSEEKYLINKRADILRMSRVGIPMPKSFFFIDEEEVIATEFQFPLVIKTINTGKGKNVSLVNSNDEIFNYLHEINKKITDVVLQEVVDYEHDLRVFVVGNEVLGCMKRIPKDGDFRANFSLGGTVEPFESTEEIRTLAVKAAKACNLEISGVDVLVGKDGKLWILEANRTPGLEGISQVFGEQIGDKAVQYMIDNAR